MELALVPIFYLRSLSLRGIIITVTSKICCLKSIVKHYISMTKLVFIIYSKDQENKTNI